MLRVIRLCRQFSNKYKVLGVKEDDSMEKIKQKYLELAKLYHPDIDPSNNNKFQQVKEAYDILSDHKQRLKHDKQQGLDSDWKLHSSLKDSNFSNNQQYQQMFKRQSCSPVKFDQDKQISRIFDQNKQLVNSFKTSDYISMSIVPILCLGIFWLGFNTYELISLSNENKNKAQKSEAMIGGTYYLTNPVNIV